MPPDNTNPPITYSAIPPSSTPLYGGTIGVASMSNTQLSEYLFVDVSGGKSGSRALNGLRDRLLDGRSSSLQDFADRFYIQKTLGLGQAG